MQTYFQMIYLTQSGLSAWLFQQNMLFAKCSFCPMHVVVSAGHEQWGPSLRRKGSLEMKAQGPSLASGYTQSMTQFFTEEWKGRQLQSHGWALPPCLVKPTTTPQGSPSIEQQQSPAWPQPPPHPPPATMVLRMPRGGHSGLGWLLKLNNVLIQQSTTTVWGESRLIKWTLNSTF